MYYRSTILELALEAYLSKYCLPGLKSGENWRDYVQTNTEFEYFTVAFTKDCPQATKDEVIRVLIALNEPLEVPWSIGLMHSVSRRKELWGR